jgi:hypothetical protein
MGKAVLYYFSKAKDMHYSAKTESRGSKYETLLPQLYKTSGTNAGSSGKSSSSWASKSLNNGQDER